jgi:hypothetical protein
MPSNDAECPRCGRAYPTGDPRALIAERQCVACDEADRYLNWPMTKEEREKERERTDAEYDCPDCGAFDHGNENCPTCNDGRRQLDVRETVSVTDFLTPKEIERAREAYQLMKFATDRFKTMLIREIIGPNMKRINRALHRKRKVHYKYKAAHLAHVVIVTFNTDSIARKESGHLWEWAEDVCCMCRAHIGQGLRWLHVGLCERCKSAPKH